MGVNFNKAMHNSPASRILNWATETKIIRKLADCKDGICDFSTAKEICESFISFDKPVYLNQALRIVRVMITKINSQKTKITRKKKVKVTKKAKKETCILKRLKRIVQKPKNIMRSLIFIVFLDLLADS